MKKIFLILISFSGFASSCSENTRLTYDPDMHDIYYDMVTDAKDSLYISLLPKEDVSTHNLTINMLGNSLKEPLRFAVEVVPEKTTAVEGLHYQKLPEYYEFPANVFKCDISFSLIKTDEALSKGDKVLTLRLKSISKLGVAYANRSDIRIMFSNMLRKPEGEGGNNDLTVFIRLFGEYSQVKHKMIIEMTGHDFWDDKYRYIVHREAYYVPYARKLYKYITENEVYDENGKRITGWNVP